MLTSHIHFLTTSINILTDPINIIAISINIPTNQINVLTDPIDILTISINVLTNPITILTNSSGAASAQGSEQASPYLAPDPETEPPKLLTYGGGLCGGCADDLGQTALLVPICWPSGLTAAAVRIC